MKEDEGMDKQHPGPSCILPPAAELDTNLFMQVTRNNLIHFHFWVGQPEYSHVRLGMLHSVIGYYLALLFLAFDWRWL
jgi:hypothetical protein